MKKGEYCYLPVFQRWAKELGLLPDLSMGLAAYINKVYSRDKLVQAINQESPFLKYLKKGDKK